MEPPDKALLPSPTRRASPHIKVWLLPSEKAAIRAKAAAHTLSDSAYLRRLGLDMPLQSTLDQEAVLELARINGDLGKLGDLLRVRLTDCDSVVGPGRIATLLANVEATQTLLLEKVRELG